MCRGGRLTIFVSDRKRRTSNLLRDVWLRCGNPRSEHDKPARRIERRNSPTGNNSLSLQQLPYAFSQFERARLNHASRNLFTTDLKQKVGHGLIFLFSPRSYIRECKRGRM